jgi:tmRNA-binding protein
MVKLEIALARGKQNHDKRDVQAKKDIDRKLQQRDYS